MKRILVLLLACILIFSVTVSLSSCWWNRDDNDPDDDTTVDPEPEKPDNGTTYNPIEGGDGIQLPVIDLDSVDNTNPDNNQTEGE